MKAGITGQHGFIGRHLCNYLNLQEGVEIVPFENHLFQDAAAMSKWVSQCDTIVHLAAMNRHNDPQVIYNTNVELVQKLIAACKKTGAAPHVLFSSSIQEDHDNFYGKSKREGRRLLEEWAAGYGGKATGMVIPNVFGPFGKPFYNSVVATFCHLTAATEKEPSVLSDGDLSLIYVNELVSDIYELTKNHEGGRTAIQARHHIKVSELKTKLLHFREQYVVRDVFPNIDSAFDLALFNTFRCYVPYSHYPRPFTKHTDDRGSFVEIVRAGGSGQFSFSTTKPGITRGNHFHTRKAERFAVIKGQAKISLRKVGTDEIHDYLIDGESPAFVDMPIWHTHNISNVGDEEMIALFWINEPYNSEDADTYFVEV